MIVQNKGHYIRHFGDVRLIPGTNELDKNQAESFHAALDNPLNKALVDRKEILVHEGEHSLSDAPFGSLKADDALEVVYDTYDLQLLDKFLKEEKSKGNKKRSKVVTAIKEQIESIKNPPADTIVDED